MPATNQLRKATRHTRHHTRRTTKRRAGISFLEVIVTLALAGTLTALIGEVFLQFSRIRKGGDESSQAITTIPEILTLINSSLATMASLPSRHQSTNVGSSVGSLHRFFLSGTDRELLIAVESSNGLLELHSFSSGDITSETSSVALRQARGATIVGQFERGLCHQIIIDGWRPDSPILDRNAASARISSVFNRPARMTFAYFDGLTWVNDWDSELNGELPSLIRVTVMPADQTSGALWFAPVSSALRIPPCLRKRSREKAGQGNPTTKLSGAGQPRSG